MRNFVIAILLSLVTTINLLGQDFKKEIESDHDLSYQFCEICKERLTAKLIYNLGIIRVEMDEPKRELEIGFREEQNSSSRILDIIKSAGYTFEIIEQDEEYIRLKIDICDHRKSYLVRNE